MDLLERKPAGAGATFLSNYRTEAAAQLEPAVSVDNVGKD